MSPILWLFLSVALLGVVFVVFVRDVRHMKWREPIRLPFVGDVYPGDKLYPFARFQRFAPYLLTILALGFVIYVILNPNMPSN